MNWQNEHPIYNFANLHDKDIPSHPWDLWTAWQEEARNKLPYTNELILATSDAQGNPSVRVVLLKIASMQDGFCWFTNRQSEKGKHLRENPKAELLWFIKEQQRQVRIRGYVEELPREIVLTYAKSRPIQSQMSAYISEQSRTIDSKETLLHKFEQAKAIYKDGQVPTSEDWSGFSLQATRFEFWQGNTNRLHDRIVFIKNDGNNTMSHNKLNNIATDSWSISRLQP